MSEFPHKIIFEKEVETPDDSGGYETDWFFLKESDAHVVPISGDTYFVAQQNESRIEYKVFMEFDPNISTSLRVKHGNEFLTIKAVIDQGGLEEILVLMCESGGQ